LFQIFGMLSRAGFLICSLQRAAWTFYALITPYAWGFEDVTQGSTSSRASFVISCHASNQRHVIYCLTHTVWPPPKLPCCSCGSQVAEVAFCSAFPVAVCLLNADRQPETEPVASKPQCATRSTRCSGPEISSSHLKQLEQQHFPSLSRYSTRAKAAIPSGRQGPQGFEIVEIARLAVLSLPSLKFLKSCQSLWLLPLQCPCRMRLELRCAPLSPGTESTRRVTRGPAVSSTS
jgi:hypothetical protein